MTSRELVRRTIEFDSPPAVPRHLWLLPWAEDRYPETVQRLHCEFPDDIVNAPSLYKEPLPVSGDRYSEGTYIDEWGCKFSNIHDGVIGIVKEPLISDWSDLADFCPPESVLNLDIEQINAFCRAGDKFVIAGTIVRPFERLSFIRTLEQALIDLMEQPPELFTLLDKIHALYRREVEAWAATEVDAIGLMDDWGTQRGLMVSPEIFRKLFKPLYKEYVEVARQYGKHVFMHSDGYILDIIPDLIEVGIDALNSQVHCMGIKELGKRFKGEITFWGEIDRQHILPYGSLEDVRREIEEMREHLYAGGGVIAQCEFGPGAKPENVLEVFKAWEDANDIER